MYFILVDDFDSTPVKVVVNPGENRITVQIQITDDNLLESIEFFNVAFSIYDKNTAGAIMGRPRMAQVAILSDDGM